MTLPSLKPIADTIGSFLLALWANLDDLLFFGGLGILCYGAETLLPGVGYMIVGLLLVLYIRPLSRWVK